MKRFFLILMFILLNFSFSYATPFLACDPQTGIIQVEIEITYNSVVSTVPGIYQVIGSDAKILDLVGRPNGIYKFRARWTDEKGWWSDWSLPFDVGKYGSPGGVRVIP